jgi:hypothetical protein
MVQIKLTDRVNDNDTQVYIYIYIPKHYFKANA